MGKNPSGYKKKKIKRRGRETKALLLSEPDFGSPVADDISPNFHFPPHTTRSSSFYPPHTRYAFIAGVQACTPQPKATPSLYPLSHTLRVRSSSFHLLHVLDNSPSSFHLHPTLPPRRALVRQASTPPPPRPCDAFVRQVSTPTSPR